MRFFLLGTLIVLLHVLMSSPISHAGGPEEVKWSLVERRILKEQTFEIRTKMHWLTEGESAGRPTGSFWIHVRADRADADTPGLKISSEHFCTKKKVVYDMAWCVGETKTDVVIHRDERRGLFINEVHRISNWKREGDDLVFHVPVSVLPDVRSKIWLGYQKRATIAGIVLKPRKGPGPYSYILLVRE